MHSKPRAHPRWRVGIAPCPILQVNELEGLDLLPQWHYWQQLPGYVRDGVVFFLQTARWACHVASATLRDLKEGHGSREMRSALAAD